MPGLLAAVEPSAPAAVGPRAAAGQVVANLLERAWLALSAHRDRAGNLREVCVGTGKENDLELYLKRPRVDGDLHGQAPFLWLATELLPGSAP